MPEKKSKKVEKKVKLDILLPEKEKIEKLKLEVIINNGKRHIVILPL